MTRQALALLGGLGLLAVVGVLVGAVVTRVAPPVAAAPTPHAEPTAAYSTPAAPAGPAAIASPVAVTNSAAAPPKADPFVHNFARQPGVKPLKPRPSPTARLSMPVNVDGCDHAYGEPAQCIPWAFPAGTTDKCAWLAAHGFTAVKVVGTDRHNLDRDGNRVACDG
jgi:hypothetical protein